MAMEITLLYILGFFSLALIFVAFFKKQYLLLLFSGIGFILCGLMLWMGVDYLSGTTTVLTTVNASVQTSVMVNDYTDIPRMFTIPLGTFFALIGLAFILISAIQLLGEDKSLMNFEDDESIDSQSEE